MPASHYFFLFLICAAWAVPISMLAIFAVGALLGIAGAIRQLPYLVGGNAPLYAVQLLGWLLNVRYGVGSRSPERLIDLTRGQSDDVAVLVPGTWSGPGYDWSRWNLIRRKLEGEGIQVYGFPWNASNSEISRRAAAVRLAKEVTNLSDSKKGLIAIVGHSNGGQVARLAAREARVDQVVTLGMPYIQLGERQGAMAKEIALGMGLRFATALVLGIALLWLILEMNLGLLGLIAESFFSQIVLLLVAVMAPIAVNVMYFSDFEAIDSFQKNIKGSQGIDTARAPLTCICDDQDELLGHFHRCQRQVAWSMRPKGISFLGRERYVIKRLSQFWMTTYLFSLTFFFALHLLRPYCESCQDFASWLGQFPDNMQILAYAILSGTGLAAAFLLVERLRGTPKLLRFARRGVSMLALVPVLRFARVNALSEMCGIPFWSRATVSAKFSMAAPPNALVSFVSIQLPWWKTRTAALIPWRHVDLVECPEVAELVASAFVARRV